MAAPRAAVAGVGEALGVQLHHPEVARAVQPRRQRVVVHAREQPGGAVERGVGGVGVALPERAQRAKPAGAHANDRIAARDVLGPGRPFPHVRGVAAPERSHRHLEGEPGAGLGWSVLQSVEQAAAGVPVAAENSLDCRTRRHQNEPLRRGLTRKGIDHLG